MRPKHIHHLFFPIGNEINARGITRWGATEISIYYPRKHTIKVPEHLQSHISIHQIELPDSNLDAIEQLEEDFEDILREDLLLCINIDDCAPIITQAAILLLNQQFEQFHHQDRPCLGPSASAFYYSFKDSIISGHPFVPTQPYLCPIIYRILVRSSNPLDKASIRDRLHYVDDMITKDKVTNAMITLENWLSLFPGFKVSQRNQRKKVYSIGDLTDN